MCNYMGGVIYRCISLSPYLCRDPLVCGKFGTVSIGGAVFVPKKSILIWEGNGKKRKAFLRMIQVRLTVFNGPSD